MRWLLVLLLAGCAASDGHSTKPEGRVRVEIPFVGETYKDPVPELATSECHNLYVEMAGAEGVTQKSLRHAPGLKRAFVIPTPLFRSSVSGMLASPGSTVSTDRLWVATEHQITEITDAIGTRGVTSGVMWTEGPCQISDNGLELLLCYPTESAAFLVNKTTGLVVELTGYTTLAFTQGASEIKSGDTIYQPATGATPHKVAFVRVSSGSWDGSAAGTIYLSTRAPGTYSPILAGAVTLSDGGATVAQVGGEVANTLPFIPSSCGVLGHRFVMGEKDSGRFWYSAQLDGLSWNGTWYYTAESKPDRLVGIVESGDVLWLLGDRSTEAWSLSWDSTNPFQPINGAVSPFGLSDALSVVDVEGVPYWIGRSQAGLVACKGEGYRARVISNPAIEALLGGETVGRAHWYRMGGHVFVLWTLGTQTLVYDVTTGLWSTRGFVAPAGLTSMIEGTSHPLPVTCIAGAFGLVWAGSGFGSSYFPTVGKIDPSYRFLDWDGNELDAATEFRVLRSRIARHFDAQGRRVFYDALTVKAQTGVGNTDEPAPEILLDWSDDSGATWSTARTRPLGAAGQAGLPIVFPGLGSSVDRVFRLRVEDPVSVNILSVYADIDVEDE